MSSSVITVPLDWRAARFTVASSSNRFPSHLLFLIELRAAGENSFWP